MSDVSNSRSGNGDLLRIGTIATLLVLGIVGFVGVLVLGAYGPDWRSGRDGGAHALSNAATGYSALVALAEATGRHPRIVRSSRLFDTEDLLVVTPERADVNVSILQERVTKPTLVVLPKWQTENDPDHQGWTRYVEPLPLWEPIGVLSPATHFTMYRYKGRRGKIESEVLTDAATRFRTPDQLQVITGLDSSDAEVDVSHPQGNQSSAENGEDVEEAERAKPVTLRPLLTDSRGGMILVQVGDGPTYVLSDPDLISNAGLKDVRQAAAALAMLDWLNSTNPTGIAFDVSLNGFEHSQSPLKLMFEPPFVAMTLAILAALILSGIHAFGRFGPVIASQRAIAFGKAALVDNSAALIRKAGREAGLGSRYVALIRERSVTAFGVPAKLRDAALDTYLDGLKGPRRFTHLASEAEAATDRRSLLEAAQALYAWQKEKIR